MSSKDQPYYEATISLAKDSITRDMILPSYSFQATTYLTKSTATSDRQLQIGECTIEYRGTVEIFRDDELLQSTRRPIVIDQPPSWFSLNSIGKDSEGIMIKCRSPKSWLPKTFTRKSQSHGVKPSATIRLPPSSLILRPGQTENGKRCATVEIPLDLTLEGLHSDEQGHVQSGGVSCSIESKWISRRTISAEAPKARDYGTSPAVVKRMVSTQRSDVSFPPVYTIDESNAASQGFSTTGSVRIILPESAMLPSLDSQYLNVDYSLELKLTLMCESGLRLAGRAEIDCQLAS
jgi:hypothetical protein